MASCPFCDRITAGEALVASTALSAGFPDAYPLADGHVLAVPRRHVERVEELGDDEWDDLFRLVRELVRHASGAGATAVNVGVNSGADAGQTVGHAHVHVIPRRTGDTADPRGGVRWVIPDRAAYWSQR